MNILPHKSWHVRRKDNIERVRRDEAKAAEEEKERQRRIALAEQEARTELLRSKNRKRAIDDTKDEAIEEGVTEEDKTKGTVDIYSGTGGHINFFKDAEDGIADKKKNVEHEKEKKEEKEKWEKNMGILTYLGQSATEDPTPWYLNSKKKRTEQDETDSARKERDVKRKNHMDPIHDLKRYVEKTKDSHSPERHRHKHKEKKKHKHKSKDKDEHTSKKTIEQLRSERLKREAEEKKKTAALLAKLRGETIPEKTETVEMSDRNRGYNSQYNPEFVRRPKDR